MPHNILREIRYITQRAQAEDSRIVTLGNLVLFSTRTRDAWLLDREDDFVEGDAFIVRERSGRVVEIRGYPTVEISAACRG